MTTNPLNDRARGGGKIGEKKLREYCEWLNRQPFVAATGGPYFINRRDKPDGGKEAFLDRRIA